MQPAMLEQWSATRSKFVSRSVQMKPVSRLHRAFLKPRDLARAQLVLQAVNDLLKRFDAACREDRSPVRKAVRLRWMISCTACSSVVNSCCASAGRGDFLGVQLLGRLENVDRVVRDAFKVADQVQKTSGLVGSFARGHGALRQREKVPSVSS